MCNATTPKEHTFEDFCERMDKYCRTPMKADKYDAAWSEFQSGVLALIRGYFPEIFEAMLVKEREEGEQEGAERAREEEPRDKNEDRD